MTLGVFLAEQLTKRVQMILAADERIRKTVRDVKINFDYDPEPPTNFSLNIDVSLKDVNTYQQESIVGHEDMLYLLDLASREFVNVVRNYRFGEYKYLRLNLLQEPTAWVSAKDKLELFRREKIDIHSLFSSMLSV